LEFARSDQNWEAALAEFLVSRELYPTSVALLNAAISLTRLGRYDEALRMYEELHERFDATMSAEERAAIDEEVSDLKRRLGELSIMVDQPGVVIEVDGHAKGTSPLDSTISVAPGRHSVRLFKAGFEPHEEQVLVASQQKRSVSVRLRPARERDALPAPTAAPVPPRVPRPDRARQPNGDAEPVLHLAASGGLLLASSFGGGASGACSEPVEHDGARLPGCRDRKRPLGPIVNAALGYRVIRGLELELSLGYLSAGERLTRSLVATGELGRRYAATDFHDESFLTAFTAMLGVGYRFDWPVLVSTHLRFGFARASLEQRNGGTFAISSPNPRNSDEVFTGTQRVSVPEQASPLWLPALAPELRFGVRISKRLSAGLGLGLLLLVAPDDRRTGATSLSGEGQRRTALDDVPDAYADGSSARPGVITLPEERRLGTVLAFSPSFGLRLEL
jgi:hypothetical protein